MKNKLKIDLPVAIKELEIATKKSVTTGLIGKYKSTFKGKGLEFDGYRAYTQDDDASMIDFKASARSENLLVKEFVEERNMDLFILVDASASMLSTSTKKIKSEYVAEVVAAIAYTALASGDNVGYALFNEEPKAEVNIRTGMDTMNFFLKDVLNPHNYGGAFSFKKALQYLNEKLRERTLVMIFSDFIFIGNEWEDEFSIVAEKFDLIGFMVRDPLDISLPKGNAQVLVSDPLSGQKMLIQTKKIRDQYEIETRKEINTFTDIFARSGSDFLLLRTDQPYLNKVINFFNERSLKWK